METCNGKDVVKCFDVVEKVWQEVDLMSERLKDILTKEIGRSCFRMVSRSESSVYTNFDENFSDVNTGYIYNIGIKDNNRQRLPTGYFGFQVSLADDLIAIPGNECPVLYMFYSEEPWSFDNGWWINFPVSDDDDQNFQVDSDVLLRWADNTIVFAVHLLDLHNEGDLRDLCAKPIVQLADNMSVDKVFGKEPDSRIIRFPEQRELIEVPEG